MHERATGQARIVDARNDIREMVHVYWGGFGSASESSNEGLWGDRRGGRKELSSLLPPVGCTGVGPPGFECGGC